MFNFAIQARIYQMSLKYICILYSYKAIWNPFDFQHIHLFVIIFNADPALPERKLQLDKKKGKRCKNRWYDFSEYSEIAVISYFFGKGFIK